MVRIATYNIAPATEIIDPNGRSGVEELQVLSFEHDLKPCTGNVEADAATRTAEFVAGVWSRPVVEEAGRRSSAIGPLLTHADLPRVEALNEGDGGVADAWVYAIGGRFEYGLDRGIASDEAQVGTASGLDSQSPLRWTTLGGLRPTARWASVDASTNSSRQAVLWGLLIGVGSSMIATGVYDAFRQKQPQR